MHTFSRTLINSGVARGAEGTDSPWRQSEDGGKNWGDKRASGKTVVRPGRR